MTQTMEEIVEAELASIIEANLEFFKSALEYRRQEDLDSYTLGRYSSVMDDLTREEDFYRHEAIPLLINNFPTRLPNSNGFCMKSICSDDGKEQVTSQKWQQDALSAIKSSGVDERALREALVR